MKCKSAVQIDAGEHRRDLLDLGEGKEGRLASGRRHPGDGLCPCRGGVPGQDVDSHGRHGGQIDVSRSQTPDLLESLQRLDQTRHADPGGGAPETLQG